MMRCFIDTNILVYALQKPYRADPVESHKQTIANALLDRLGLSHEIVISTQVMGELFNTLTRKGPTRLSATEAFMTVGLATSFTVIPTDASLVQAAMQRSIQSQISYYDSLIVEAAIRAEAAILYTEDMQHGMRYGLLELRNPFLI